MYSVDGPWTRKEEDELLELYDLKPIPGLDDSYKFDKEFAPGLRGVGIYSRSEALEKIKQVRRIAFGGGPS